MKLFFKTPRGLEFSIEVDPWDTVLVMKQKIEMTQGIPVSKQLIFFKSKLLLKDDQTLQQRGIVEKSRFEFLFTRFYRPYQNIYRAFQRTTQSSLPSNSIRLPSNSIIRPILNIQDSPTTMITNHQDANVMLRRNNDQVLHNQNEQSPLPSNSLEEFFLAAKAISNIQDSSVMQMLHQIEQSSNSIQGSNIASHWPVTTTSMSQMISNIQDSTLMDNHQVLPQIGQSSSVTSISIGGVIYDEDHPLTIENFSNIRSYWPEESPGSNTNQVLFQTEQSPPSNSTGQRINDQDLPVRVGSSNQVVQTGQSQPSNSIKEVINIPDSPVRRKMRVMMLPYSRENKPVRKFALEVNASEKVEVLRRELEKIQQLNLPEEGYIFIHKQRIMDDDQSFIRNGVAQGDTIEIFPGSINT
ncbi:hypothetical protein EUTSA_v10029513mg [Eutrema salsugineum]|uniref:Ubiquitin-like domain-containing protein n=1 Tax=Eutrema salsugineum TaxID=72664 RepID=V4MZC6_EUTSA|nr:hypothetical protein EUTSA_v10029513mg [Eutrema salsugineum]